VAQESLAYETAEVEDALNHLARAREIVTQASTQHTEEE
jgi:hypothetical protein